MGHEKKRSNTPPADLLGGRKEEGEKAKDHERSDPGKEKEEAATSRLGILFRERGHKTGLYRETREENARQKKENPKRRSQDLDASVLLKRTRTEKRDGLFPSRHKGKKNGEETGRE